MTRVSYRLLRIQRRLDAMHAVHADIVACFVLSRDWSTASPLHWRTLFTSGLRAVFISSVIALRDNSCKPLSSASFSLRSETSTASW